MAIYSSVTGAVSSLLSPVTSQAWEPLVSLCKNGILSQFQNLKHGKLVVFEGGSSKASAAFGSDKEGLPIAFLDVRDEKFWVRLALFADMLFILNRNYLSNGSTITSVISSGLAGLVRGSNNLKNARLNISAHYDISNEMFAAFLSKDMTYSCPIWLPKSNPKSASETLYEAQMRKLDRFIDNTHIKGTDHVLEIGTGWGSFAMRAVERTGCRVTSLTLSIEQKELAEERIQAAGMSDKITVLLCDYRSLEIPETGAFDKAVSIEMLEAVGKEYLVTYFKCIDKLLKKEGGIACFQCITMPDGRYEAYAKSDDFIRRYIFPGGHLPAVSELVSSIQLASGGSLVVDSIENIGPHYAKTLRLWREAFLDNWETTIKPQLIKEKSAEGMDDEGAEIFKRKWDYYFRYSEAGFSTKTLGDVIITVGREGAMQMMEDVPL
ncbi:cyclopropane-fatty-acyl-phospholipid synthase [Stemphylium lycopersici]|uniref:Cyclopropane-fatty-acyl-phospholipid synthase n=1 Tax=Stemphylium lycopersici TaxID=183478 RepID=A0A364N9Q4_STELY|nr:cyclopropane-fatty-acyl-phospholipid synthase [Stemphylium lycopersici]RAQ99536.1 cyclopropane-fatty-acyl-phospholipid synthase [Stemphylium lycopersici]RAR13980.1 cyclopropane-fatty-acyl-phospholipid synthase [Stemphylium lycopersici]